MISDSELHQSIARLCDSKSMNAPGVRKAVRLAFPKRPRYVRTPEEQLQLDRVAEQIREVERSRV